MDYDSSLPGEPSGYNDGGLLLKEAMISKASRRQSVRQQLELRRAMHQREIADIDAALTALDSHKDVEQLLEALGKAGVRP